MMVRSAKEAKVDVRAISFKGCLQAVRSWEPRIGSTKLSRVDKQEMLIDLSFVIAHCKVFDRPGRSDPRCLKRRPKPYQLLTKKGRDAGNTA
jgi:hypothetical protein